MDAIRTKRRGNVFDGSDTEESADQIEIHLENKRREPSVVDNHPYDNQQVYSGTLRYSEPVIIEGMSPSTEEYKITYRSGSGLVMIEGFGDSSRLDTVIDEMVAGLPNFTLGSVRGSKTGIWSFIFSSDNQPFVKVRDFEQNELLTLSDPPLLDKDRSEIVSNYSPHTARVTFEYNSEHINFRYSDRTISFAGEPSDEAREYVLQMIEKYIIGDAVLEELQVD